MVATNGDVKGAVIEESGVSKSSSRGAKRRGGLYA